MAVTCSSARSSGTTMALPAMSAPMRVSWCSRATVLEPVDCLRVNKWTQLTALRSRANKRTQLTALRGHDLVGEQRRDDDGAPRDVGGDARVLAGGKSLFINSQTRPLHAYEGNQTTRKGTSP